MKKAYVKPVFLAEEFVGTTAVAGCGEGSVNKPVELEKGQYLCYKVKPNGSYQGDNGHQIGKNNAPVLQYWDYAGANKEDDEKTDVYLFTDSSIVCDFLWNGQGSTVKGWSTNGQESGLVWDETQRTDSARNFFDFRKKLLEFFCGPNADNDNHNPGYNDKIFFS